MIFFDIILTATDLFVILFDDDTIVDPCLPKLSIGFLNYPS